jgi:hypothetical protein
MLFKRLIVKLYSRIVNYINNIPTYEEKEYIYYTNLQKFYYECIEKYDKVLAVNPKSIGELYMKAGMTRAAENLNDYINYLKKEIEKQKKRKEERNKRKNYGI